MMFNQFIARLAPLFAGLGLIKAFRLEDVAKPRETELPRSEQESCTRKQKFSLHSKSRQKKQMYSRRLTRNMENYAKTHE